MVVLNKIYTRTGDDGTTALGTGERRKKYDRRISAYGTIDEVNAALGVVRLHTTGEVALDAALSRIQNDLFDVGADLSVPGESGDRLRLTDAPVLRLEAEIAAMNAALPKLMSFILPGGTPGAAHAHTARTVVRRAEREVVRLMGEEAVTPALLRYLNRLSDHLFVLARVLNGNGVGDVLWSPGQNLTK